MKFEELQIGMSQCLSKSFTEEDVKAFASLSLDNNPIHTDKTYGANSIFKQNIVHGFLSSSLFSAIIGTQLPGKGSIYLNQTLDFKKPVFINQQVTAIVTIQSIHTENRIVTLTTTCVDADGHILIEGTAAVKIL